jgi:hypothetical protein
MDAFLASTKRQRASIVLPDSSRMILIRQVVPNVQLDIMRKIFLKFRTKRESVTTDVQDVLVASMVLKKNQFMKQQVVLNVLLVDFQIWKLCQQQMLQTVPFAHRVQKVDGTIRQDVRKNRNV